MSRRIRASLVALLCCIAPLDAARAQDRTGLLAGGIRAYENLELQRAMDLLTRALRPGNGQDSLAGDRRADALAYLAAAEYFSGSRSVAEARFAQLVTEHPRHRLDHLIFPPALTELYAEVRRETKAVTVRYRPTARLRPGKDSYSLTLLATSPHEVTVSLWSEEGESRTELYSGVIADSLDVSWDGRGADGAPVESGDYQIEIVSLRGGREVREMQMPVHVSANLPDTLPHPVPPPPIPPRQRSSNSAFRALGVGVGGALAVMVLPGLVAPGAEPSSGRTFLAAGLTITGLIAFSSQINVLKPHPRERDAREAWTDWQRRDTAVKRENAERMAQPTLFIRVGEPTTVSRRRP